MDARLRDRANSPPARICGIPAAMRLVAADSTGADLVAEIHRPANGPIHDRLATAIFARLLPGVIEVVTEGIAAGEFVAQDPHRAAAFVLAAISAVDELVGEPADLEPVIRDVQTFVLRGLGAASSCP